MPKDALIAALDALYLLHNTSFLVRNVTACGGELWALALWALGLGLWPVTVGLVGPTGLVHRVSDDCGRNNNPRQP